MKIMCQEHYDEVVRYAERIGDKTLEERLNDLKRWERNPNCPCEIELYKDSAPYSFLFRQLNNKNMFFIYICISVFYKCKGNKAFYRRIWCTNGVK